MRKRPKVKATNGSDRDKLIFRDSVTGKDVVYTSVNTITYHQNPLSPVGSRVTLNNSGGLTAVSPSTVLTSDNLVAGPGIKIIKNDNGTTEVTLDDSIQQAKEGKIDLHDLDVVLHSDNPMRELLEVDPESMFRTKSDEVLSWKTVREIVVAMFDRLSTPSKAKKRSKIEL